ncbi:MAG: hypothetical protein Q9213_003669 [Squamulea squamosa]
MAAKRLLEVESKFLFNPSLVATFQSNKGCPAFKRLEALGTHSFIDTYYDHRDILSKNGIWLRQRTSSGFELLEAKVRISGNFSRSTFDEIIDHKQITDTIRPHLPQFNMKKQNLGLHLLAKYTTTRQEFRADDRFTVVLDRTDFGHSVGEVELKMEDEAEAHQEIDLFMARYPWFFTNGKAEGKLEAYFRVMAR